MVMVVESDDTRRTITETLLVSSRFAVAPVASVDGALAICRGMAPSVIVCNEDDESRVREGLRPLVIPILVTDTAPEALDELVERIRLAVRGAPRWR